MVHLKYIFFIFYLFYPAQNTAIGKVSQVNRLNLHLAESGASSQKNAEDLEFILKGVNSIHVPGSPGFLSVYGSAFSVISGKIGEGENTFYHPVVAAGNLGQGKLIGVTHDAFLAPEKKTQLLSDKNQFILNSIEWAGTLNSQHQSNNLQRYNNDNNLIKPKPKPNQRKHQQQQVTKIALLVTDKNDADPIGDLLLENDISTTKITLDELQQTGQLTLFDVVLTKKFFAKEKAPILKEYVENGGGLIIGLTSWAYHFFMEVPGHFGSNFPANMISSDSGFVWRNDESDAYADPTTEDGQFNSSTLYLRNTHVLDSWQEIKNYLSTGKENPDQSLLQFSSVLEYGLVVIPPNDDFWQENNFYNDALNFTQVSGQPIPSHEKPVTEIFEKFALQIFHCLSTAVLKPVDIRAHPGSVNFPGEVSKQNSIIEIILNQESGSATHKKPEVISIRVKKPSWFYSKQRTANNPWSFVPNSINTCDERGIYPSTRTRSEFSTRRPRPTGEENIELSNKHPLWYSTGLYAPAGEVITVSIKSQDNVNLDAFQVQIGSHTDDISRHPGWERSPRVSVRKNFVDNEIRIASSYGGLIYVVIPEHEISENEQTYEVKVIGSIKAPLYKLGETSIREWRETIQHESGPWAEFVSEKIVLTVPSSSVRNMDDPEDLLLFWDQVMDAIADLAAIPRERFRQERIVPDIQISAGFMHSGYPIMTFLPEGDLAINVSVLRRDGSWGHFHELGHNHQNGDWTFDGTEEVGCNLFALYVLNTVCGISTENTREEMTPEWYRKAVTDYIVGGQDFQKWKSDPFLALMFFVQLQKVYGWVAYKQVFAEYHKLVEHPETDEEKMDLWLVMFSSVVEEDLSLFFVSWGIPISEAASGQVSSYPEAGFLIFDLLHD